MHVQSRRAAIVLVVMSALPQVVLAQRSPAAAAPPEIRARIALLESQRNQMKDQAARLDAERRDLEMQLDRVRREQESLGQQISINDAQMRQLQQELLQAH
ncbi:MAG TPA: hypothetical protein VMG60_10500 [Burkholderiaceae bacterium]|nr:hypothetical protein [Burkholderiaceae bacterium]